MNQGAQGDGENRNTEEQNSEFGHPRLLPIHFARVRRCPEVVYEVETEQKTLDDKDRVGHETRVLVDIVHFVLCFDQLNAGSLAVFELACGRIQAVISACSNPSKVNTSTARLMTVAASDGVQPALCGYVVRRAREEHELDLLRGTGADDGTNKFFNRWSEG